MTRVGAVERNDDNCSSGGGSSINNKKKNMAAVVPAASASAAVVAAAAAAEDSEDCNNLFSKQPMLPHLNCSLTPTVETAATSTTVGITSSRSMASIIMCDDSSVVDADRSEDAVVAQGGEQETTDGDREAIIKRRMKLRSMSVPTNLPDVAEKFMTSMMEEEGEEDQEEDDDEHDDHDLHYDDEDRQDRQHMQGGQKRGHDSAASRAVSKNFVPPTTAAAGGRASSTGGTVGTDMMSKLVVPVSSINIPGGGNNNHNNFVVAGSGFLPLSRGDSLGSEQDFFLPFDEEEGDDRTNRDSDQENEVVDEEGEQATASELAFESTPEVAAPATVDDTATNHRRQEAHEQQRRREVAVAGLEAFFFGEELSALLFQAPPSQEPEPKPLETLVYHPAACEEEEVKEASQQQKQQPGASPICTAEFDSYQKHYQKNEAPVSEIMEPRGDSSRVIENEENENIPDYDDGRHFSRLKMLDRTTSMPVDMNRRNSCSSLRHSYSSTFSAPHRIPRKSSLKKMSSYGQITAPAAAAAATSSSPTTTPPGSPNLKRNVSFGSMKIREYNVEISDHPSCSYGPPIQLSWDYKEKEDETLDSYEEKRSKRKRRTGHELVLSFYERHFMLIKTAGYSKSEIRETMKEVERVKRERQITDMFLPTMQIDEQMENVVDTVKRLFGGK